ncbi:MAG TPA: hypothetical protein VFP36_11710 [Usitatibacter sp.]|nr:hypothetical protein [Usitatibacter sp.]
MRTVGWLALGVMSLGLPAQAAGEEGDLSSRSKALAARAHEAPHAAAPFTHAQDPLEFFPFAAANEAPGHITACADRAMCYDARLGNFVYRGARGYMPRIQGLTAEGVGLRHDRLILRYSFR